MSDNKHVNRIPFEDIASSTTWDFPTWENGARVVSSVKKKQPPERKPKGHEVIEDVLDHTPQPITADQLQQISEEAEREGREHGYKEGYEQGFSEGEQKGLKLGEQKAYAEIKPQLEDQQNRFKQLAEALLDPVAMQDGELENLVLDMAVHLAKHLISKELTEDPSSLFHIVQRAVASLPAGAQNVRIYLHADDVELAHEAFISSGRDWTFYADEQLSRGGCRIESHQSIVDYTVERRLQIMLDEASFQGEIESDELAPVEDYRPARQPTPETASQVGSHSDPDPDPSESPLPEKALQPEPHTNDENSSPVYNARSNEREDISDKDELDSDAPPLGNRADDSL